MLAAMLLSNALLVDVSCADLVSRDFARIVAHVLDVFLLKKERSDCGLCQSYFFGADLLCKD